MKERNEKTWKPKRSLNIQSLHFNYYTFIMCVCVCVSFFTHSLISLMASAPFLKLPFSFVKVGFGLSFSCLYYGFHVSTFAAYTDTRKCHSLFPLPWVFNISSTCQSHVNTGNFWRVMWGVLGEPLEFPITVPVVRAAQESRWVQPLPISINHSTVSFTESESLTTIHLLL